MLPDYVVPGLRVVLAGTAVGERSLARAHYAGRGNSFWRLLQEAWRSAFFHMFCPARVPENDGSGPIGLPVSG